MEFAQLSELTVNRLRFKDSESVDVELLSEFVDEAVQLQKSGLEFVTGPPLETVIPPAIAALVNAFAPYKQREFCELITTAKRADTKERRLASAL